MFDLKQLCSTFVLNVFLLQFLAALPDFTILEEMSLDELEARLVEIDTSLEPLALFSLNTGVGPIGYRSMPFDDGNHPEWVRVDLGQEYQIDEIVLIPTVWRDMAKGFVADAFPQAFTITIGSEREPEGRIVAEFDLGQEKMESIAPFIIKIEPTTATWVRLDAVRLGTLARDGKYILQLAELMAFEGAFNQALRGKVTTSKNTYSSNAWNNRCLVDGILPYVMNSAVGEKSLPLISRVGVGSRPMLSIDLGEPSSFHRLRLHAVGQGDTMPQAYKGDFGIPRRFRLEAANQPDFSDGVLVAKINVDQIFQMGPIMEWAVPKTTARYIRLIATIPYMFSAENNKGTRIGFAELELLGEEGNVAFGKKVSTNFKLSSGPHSQKALTDGRNLYGRILPIKDWLEQLADRRDLETLRPYVSLC